MTFDRYDLTEAGLLPTPAEESAFHNLTAMDSYPPPPSPMHRIYRDIMQKRDDIVNEHLEDLAMQTQWSHEQVRKASENGNRLRIIADHRRDVLQWMLVNLDLLDENGEPDELMREVLEYAISDDAGLHVQAPARMARRRSYRDSGIPTDG